MRQRPGPPPSAVGRFPWRSVFLPCIAVVALHLALRKWDWVWSWTMGVEHYVFVAVLLAPVGAMCAHLLSAGWAASHELSEVAGVARTIGVRSLLASVGAVAAAWAAGALVVVAALILNHRPPTGFDRTGAVLTATAGLLSVVMWTASGSVLGFLVPRRAAGLLVGAVTFVMIFASYMGATATYSVGGATGTLFSAEYDRGFALWQVGWSAAALAAVVAIGWGPTARVRSRVVMVAAVLVAGLIVGPRTRLFEENAVATPCSGDPPICMSSQIDDLRSTVADEARPGLELLARAGVAPPPRIVVDGKTAADDVFLGGGWVIAGDGRNNAWFQAWLTYILSVCPEPSDRGGSPLWTEMGSKVWDALAITYRLADQVHAPPRERAAVMEQWPQNYDAWVAECRSET